jgi:putative ABC transport system permease protein
MRPLLRRVWHAIRRRQLDADLTEELSFHYAMKRRDLEDAGLVGRAASIAAKRSLGSVALAQDQSRDVWCPWWLQGLGQDIRLACRSWRATTIVTTIAILSLALGIGANTAVFSIINSVLLRSLPVRQPDRLVVLSNSPYGGSSDWDYPIFQEISHRTNLFDGSIASSPTRFKLTVGGETQFVDGAWVSGSFFQTLGVPAWRGRTLSALDDVRGGGPEGPVTVISYSLWQRQFGAASDITHLTLTLDRVRFTIVGVTPPSFFGTEVGRSVDVIVPLGTEPLSRGRETWLDRHDYWLTIMARLRADQTIEAATQALRGVQPQIRESTLPTNWRREYLDTYLKAPITLVPAATGLSVLRTRYQRVLVTTLVVVALMLLLACANVAALLMARSSARRHELGLRLALGASRWRLVRQLLIESAVLAAAGTAVGALLASWGSRLVIRQLSTPSSGVFLDLSLDWRVLTFTIAVASATTLLFGVAPAWAGSAVDPIEHVIERAPRPNHLLTRRLGEGSLVAAQVALSLVLVVAAGLFIRTFLSLATRQTGFDRRDVLLAEVDAQGATPDLSQRIPRYDQVRKQVRDLPGVRDVALSALSPVAGRGFAAQFEVSGGTPFTDGPYASNAVTNVVSPQWFSTLRIPFIEGRDFTDADRPETPHVAIVNQTFARASMKGASPIGHTLTMTTPGRVMRMDIVGVVADSVYFSLRETVHPTVYTPLGQFYFSPSALPSTTLIVRTIGPTGLVTRSIGETIHDVSPQLAVTFLPLTDQVNASLNQERLIALFAGFFSVLALLLAGLGLYGVTSQSVTQQRTELGIRMALGAAPSAVVQLVLARVAWLVGTGIAVGAIVSLWASKYVATLLYGLEPRDPATFFGAIVVLASVGALAAWVPAWRASRIDPAVTLRYE